MIKGYIIDMDGTILDSMHIWDELGSRFLELKNIIPQSNLKDVLAPLSIIQAVTYLKETYHLEQSIETLVNEVDNLLASIYENELSLKPGAQEFINQCYKQNKKLCLLTANNYQVTIKILDKYNLTSKFKQIITGDQTSLDKQSGEIYTYAATKLDLNKDECIVIEDAYHAIKAAKSQDFCVWAISDPSNQKDWTNICKICDAHFNDLTKMEVIS